MKQTNKIMYILAIASMLSAGSWAEDYYGVAFEQVQAGRSYLVARPTVDGPTMEQFIEHTRALLAQVPADQTASAVVTFKYPVQLQAISLLNQNGVLVTSIMTMADDGTIREEPFMEHYQESGENQFPISDQIWVGAKAKGTGSDLASLYSQAVIAVVDPGPVDVASGYPGCEIIHNQPVQQAYLAWVAAKAGMLGGEVPSIFALHENYPNPFNPETKISFDLPAAAEVEAIIYNVLGQKVKTMVQEYKGPGTYSLTWNGKDDSNMEVAAGVYLFRLTAGEFSRTQKMLLLK